MFCVFYLWLFKVQFAYLADKYSYEPPSPFGIISSGLEHGGAGVAHGAGTDFNTSSHGHGISGWTITCLSGAHSFGFSTRTFFSTGLTMRTITGLIWIGAGMNFVVLTLVIFFPPWFNITGAGRIQYGACLMTNVVGGWLI